MYIISRNIGIILPLLLLVLTLCYYCSCYCLLLYPCVIYISSQAVLHSRVGSQHHQGLQVGSAGVVVSLSPHPLGSPATTCSQPSFSNCRPGGQLTTQLVVFRDKQKNERLQWHSSGHQNLPLKSGGGQKALQHAILDVAILVGFCARSRCASFCMCSPTFQNAKEDTSGEAIALTSRWKNIGELA